jgi:hypothetical protein
MLGSPSRGVTSGARVVHCRTLLVAVGRNNRYGKGGSVQDLMSDSRSQLGESTESAPVTIGNQDLCMRRVPVHQPVDFGHTRVWPESLAHPDQLVAVWWTKGSDHRTALLKNHLKDTRLRMVTRFSRRFTWWKSSQAEYHRTAKKWKVDPASTNRCQMKWLYGRRRAA